MDDLAKPNPILRLKWSIRSIQSTQCEQCPIMALPIDSQPTPTVPTVVSKLSAPASNILPSLPLFPLTHYFLHIYDPKTISLGEDITEVRRGTHFIRVEDQDDNHYWITCWMDNTGVEFSIWVGWDLVIDPNPQDMLSWLWSSREFDAAVVGHLSEPFDGPKGCNIDDWEGRCEIQGRCKGEECVGKG